MTATDERTTLQRRTVLAMGLSALGLPGAADAQALADLVDLSVVDRGTGREMRVWSHQGRVFVAGRPGARYGVRVRNNTDGRLLVVMSVDGVNVLTGETAGYGQRGYVFSPYESYDVTGWRKSDAEVAAFTFAPLSRSYAARTGRPADVGVIGIAAFRERAIPPVAVAPAGPPGRFEVDELVVAPPAAGLGRLARPPAPSPESAAASRRSEKLGTGHGEREWSAVTTVAFERATRHPQLIRRIEYDSYENLVALGVIRRPLPRDVRPRPFPAGGYVPDPPGGF